ncbi:MAG: hypothetical protein D3908_04045 [Candidatus Electrothrix sp. AUS4]|nr:hypothetical protein [Candidatus Electrothrix sp. AUS4]
MNDSTSCGLIKGKISKKNGSSAEFQCSLAVVIGIDRYGNGIPPLSMATTHGFTLRFFLPFEEQGYISVDIKNDILIL